jgi:hypothetical protein
VRKQDRCRGITKSGKQCSRSSQEGIDFCGLHYTTPSFEVEPASKYVMWRYHVMPDDVTFRQFSRVLKLSPNAKHPFDGWYTFSRTNGIAEWSAYSRIYRQCIRPFKLRRSK